MSQVSPERAESGLSIEENCLETGDV
jgi:hypothetical protein